MKCEYCNKKEARFKTWIHRTITSSSYFCSDKCCVNYARKLGWKLKKGSLVRGIDEKIKMGKFKEQTGDE